MTDRNNDIINIHKQRIVMDKERIKEEIGVAKLFITILAAILATLTGFIGGHFEKMDIFLLLISCIADIVLFLFLIKVFFKLNEPIEKL